MRERMRALRAKRKAMAHWSTPTQPRPRPAAEPAPASSPAAPVRLPDASIDFAWTPSDQAVIKRSIETWTRLLAECPADYPLRRASIIARLAELGAQP